LTIANSICQVALNLDIVRGTSTLNEQSEVFLCVVHSIITLKPH